MLTLTPNNLDNTPKHCWYCEKFAGCQQAQNMTADTVPAPGIVDFDAADHFCEDCHDGKGNCVALDSSEELDSPAHCNVCGVPLECELTEEGKNYVRESLRDGAGCCRELWPSLWPELVPDEEEDEDEDEDETSGEIKRAIERAPLSVDWSRAHKAKDMPYFVLCKPDADESELYFASGDYCFASRRAFINRAAAEEYAKGIAPGRKPIFIPLHEVERMLANALLRNIHLER